MSYYDLKTIHLFWSISFLCLIFSSLYQTKSKLLKISTGLFSLASLISGVVMLQRLGLELTPPYPFWVVAKVLIWMTLSVTTPIVVKRAPERAPRLFIPYLFLILVALGMSVYKPY